LPRQRTIPSARSKAIALIAGGAFSLAAVASAAAATWTRESSGSLAGAPQAAAAGAGLTITDQATRPQASPQAVSLALRSFQIRSAEAGRADARWQKARVLANRRADAVQDATEAARSQAAAPPQQASTAGYAVASGSPEKIAKAMLRSFGWSASQFSCLYPLWAHESGWSVTAANPDGAYGIPQALPGAKMSSAGPNWQTNAATQIRWGLEYIKSLYGSPCGAWDHEQATGWY
jgi:hypothetical protein